MGMGGIGPPEIVTETGFWFVGIGGSGARVLVVVEGGVESGC